MKRRLASEAIGDVRDLEHEPAAIEFPDVVVTFAAASAAGWEAWFDDFVVAGNNAHGREKSGTLTFLAPNGRDVLGQLELRNLGIFRLAPEPAAPGTEGVARYVASLYCEQIDLAAGP